jgi:hypothetical protein
MKQITLTESPVQFIENRAEGMHHYILELNELTGVTTILKDVIYRDKYSGIDDAVLRNAADRGMAIHAAVQAYMMRVDYKLDPDLQPYELDARVAWDAWTNNPACAGLVAEAVEYLVSDCKEIASKIDVVRKVGDGKYAIADIKTTYQVDIEYVSWQLSVYKYLFEHQNPNSEVVEMQAFWYNRREKEWQIREIQDKGTAEVERLLDAWRKGEYWGMPMPADTEYPAPLLNIGQMYAEMEYKIKEYTAQRNEFRSRLQGLMEEHNVPQVKLEGFTCTYVGESERKGFDYKRLIEEHPELWDGLLEEYQTTTRVKPSLKITLK